MPHTLPRTLAALVAVALLLVPVGPASAQDDPSGGPVPEEAVQPIDDVLQMLLDAVGELGLRTSPNSVSLVAEDAVDAALALSLATFEDGTADTVLLGRDDLFADSLSSVAAQGAVAAPLLLTPSGFLDQRVADEIVRLQASRVLILGGHTAVAPAVEEDLADLDAALQVDRIAGPTRIETATETATAAFTDPDTVVLVRAYPTEDADDSQAFVDALAVGPLASENGWPVLLTHGDVPHSAVQTYLDQTGSVTDIVVVGGAAAVPETATDHLTDLGYTVSRIAGANRFATAVEIAKQIQRPGFALADRIVLSEATDETAPIWAAGFAAAAHGAANDGAVLLAAGDDLPEETASYLLDALAEDYDRSGNTPLVCNSFTTDQACQTAADIMSANLIQLSLDPSLLNRILTGLISQIETFLATGDTAAIGEILHIVASTVTERDARYGPVVNLSRLLDGVGADATVLDDIFDTLIGIFGADSAPDDATLATVTTLTGLAALHHTEAPDLLALAVADMDGQTSHPAVVDAFLSLLAGDDVALEDQAAALPTLTLLATGVADDDRAARTAAVLPLAEDTDTVAVLQLVADIVADRPFHGLFDLVTALQVPSGDVVTTLAALPDAEFTSTRRLQTLLTLVTTTDTTEATDLDALALLAAEIEPATVAEDDFDSYQDLTGDLADGADVDGSATDIAELLAGLADLVTGADVDLGALLELLDRMVRR